MKIKSGFVIEKVGTEYLAVAVGERAKEFSGFIRLNGSGAYFWNLLSEGDLSEDEIVARAMTDFVEKFGKVNGRVAFEAMRAGDEAAKEVIDMYLKYLESGLASMINIFQPEVLSIGGGISGEGDPLVEMILPAVRNQQYGFGFTELTKVCIAELGNDAGIIGAAFLGI